MGPGHEREVDELPLDYGAARVRPRQDTTSLFAVAFGLSEFESTPTWRRKSKQFLQRLR